MHPKKTLQRPPQVNELGVTVEGTGDKVPKRKGSGNTSTSDDTQKASKRGKQTHAPLLDLLNFGKCDQSVFQSLSYKV